MENPKQRDALVKSLKGEEENSISPTDKASLKDGDKLEVKIDVVNDYDKATKNTLRVEGVSVEEEYEEEKRRK